MKTILVALVLLVVPQQESVDRLMDYGVKIHIVAGENEGSGSGVYVSKDTILTANHLYAEGVRLYLDDDHKMEAVVVKRDDDYDLMLLKVTGEHKFASLGSMPKRMDSVLTVGYPMGNSNVMVGGKIADVKDAMMLVDSTVVRGMSGGGVYSNSGMLVGICSALWGDQDTKFMVVVSVSLIRDFLKGG